MIVIVLIFLFPSRILWFWTFVNLLFPIIICLCSSPLSIFSAFLGQLKDILLYMMVSVPLFQEYVIFQWQSHSAPKPERLVNFVDVF